MIGWVGRVVSQNRMSIVQCSCCGPCIRDDPSGEDDMEDRAMEVQFRPCREEERWSSHILVISCTICIICGCSSGVLFHNALSIWFDYVEITSMNGRIANRVVLMMQSSRGEVGRWAGVGFGRRTRENGEAEETQEEAQADRPIIDFYRKNPVVCNDGSQATAHLLIIRSGAELIPQSMDSTVFHSKTGTWLITWSMDIRLVCSRNAPHLALT